MQRRIASLFAGSALTAASAFGLAGATAVTAAPAAVHLNADGTTIAVRFQLQHAVHRQALHSRDDQPHRPTWDRAH